MNLTGYYGHSSLVNPLLMKYALEHLPSLILDCANAANTHHLFPDTDPEVFERVFVLNIDLLYKFRDVLKIADKLAQSVNANHVVVTMFKHLFHYQDYRENRDIYEHAWELMSNLSKTHDVVVGVHTDQLKLASKHCNKLRILDKLENGTHAIKPTPSSRQHYRRAPFILQGPAPVRPTNIRKTAKKPSLLLWQHKLR